MITTALRRIALGVVPAVLVAGAVAGCTDSAPSVQAPPETAGSSAEATAGSTGSSVPTVAPTDSTDAGVPTVSTAPTAPSATGDPAKVCTAEQDSFDTPAVLAPSTKKATWGKPLDLTEKYGGTVTLTAGKPVAKKPASDDFFAPKGQVYLLIKVTAAYKSGDSTFLGSSFFTLRDSKKNVCDRDLLGSAVQKRERFDSVTMRKSTGTYVGTLVFEVPPGQDYTKYTLMYRADSFDTKSANAPVAWTH